MRIDLRTEGEPLTQEELLRYGRKCQQKVKRILEENEEEIREEEERIFGKRWEDEE